MTAGIEQLKAVQNRSSAPRYELRTRHHRPGDSAFEIWQLPSPASPHLPLAVRVAGLRGRNLELVEHYVLKRLAQAGVKLAAAHRDHAQRHAIDEELALRLGLLFRALAPMRRRDNMRAVAQGIEAMDREEAAYWLGMAMHRKNPRRVLTALRFLLSSPKS
jgi:hypothetical protein